MQVRSQLELALEDEAGASSYLRVRLNASWDGKLAAVRAAHLHRD